MYVDKLAAELRADLKVAGVTRPKLFEQSEHRMKLRAHDLRGTFVTLSLANGKTETWVQQRTGHTSSIMINRYRRAARKAEELALGDWTPLDTAIPELGEARPKGAETAPAGDATGDAPTIIAEPSPETGAISGGCTRRDSNPQALRQRILSPSCIPIPPLARVHWNSYMIHYSRRIKEIFELWLNMKDMKNLLQKCSIRKKIKDLLLVCVKC